MRFAARAQGSITYRIAVGPRQGRKVLTLQTLPACDEPFDDPVGEVAGFSLHAGVEAKAHERKKLERLCRYISRPAVAEKRLSLTPNGNVRYQLKTPYRDGTTHVIFEPLDFMARLAALVPKPGVHLTRYHGAFVSIMFLIRHRLIWFGGYEAIPVVEWPLSRTNLTFVVRPCRAGTGRFLPFRCKGLQSCCNHTLGSQQPGEVYRRRAWHKKTPPKRCHVSG